MSALRRLGLALGLAALSASSAACTTNAYCFRDCEEDAGVVREASADAPKLDGFGFDAHEECIFNCTDASDEPDVCVPSNGGVEICDGLDNDCHGGVDDVDPTDVHTCGGCPSNPNDPSKSTDCTKKVANANGLTCTAGVCGYTSCASDYYDFDKSAADGCETFCQKALVGGVAVTDETDPGLRCNNKDDDCDGQVDEDLDVCGDVLNCGRCGSQCSVAHGTPKCTHTGTAACDTSNTICEIAACDPGWVDADNKAVTGCEYPCVQTNGGVEICDNLDNDCNGLVDQFDPALVDARVGVSCQGGNEGICADAANAGTTACHNGTVSCDGAKVVTPGQVTESCNGKDDDCNGKTDDNATGDLRSCGSNVGNCQAGQQHCVAGAWVCQNEVLPKPESCNGQDDDCDGVIDDGPTIDEGAACGSTVGACVAGTYKCVSGALQCVGATTPGAEICNGIDDDCNGVTDDNVPSAGTACGSAVGACTAGHLDCVAGKLSCVGATGGKAETCNGIDDDCNGVTDDGVPGQNVACGPSGGACVQGRTKCQAGAIVCLGGKGPASETCNGIDDDCNGVTDDGVPGVGAACGSSVGACQAGTVQCQSGALTCVGAVGAKAETCNGQDDDCNGATDENVPGQNAPCGSAVGACRQGTNQCQSGAFTCVGAVGAGVETCNGVDDDCNGTIDDHLTDVGTACNQPVAPPSGATSPCKAGVFQCVGGARTCVGSVVAQSQSDACGVDSNCDGVLTGQPDLQNDAKNCGTCGNDCTALGGHGVWSCSAGKCVRSSCSTGFINCDANANDCERACTFTSAVESCNGKDDNCDCNVDEVKDATHPNGLVVPSTTQICGVGLGAANPGPCTTGTSVSCTGGSWVCGFPAGYCTGASCSATTDGCDGLDNNCNGQIDEPFKHPVLSAGALGDACASDDAAPGSQGQCRTTGTYVCNGTTGTRCGAAVASCASLPGGCTEVCDGIDNDCDGTVDETKNVPGSNVSFYVKPAVVKVRTAPDVWMYQYEASRPGATVSTPGSGNGYWTSAPAGSTIDKTPACSVPGKIPWFNVTPTEATQVCSQMGGRVCATSEFQRACRVNAATSNNCTWGYGPLAQCKTSHFGSTGYCNLGAYDFDTSTLGIQSGLLPTAYWLGISPQPSSPARIDSTCYADWSGLLGNAAGSDKLYDVTGNLREITQCDVSGCTSTQYPLMGGAFDTQDEQGATCSFSFYTVDATFQLYDVGFRCCFDTTPL